MLISGKLDRQRTTLKDAYCYIPVTNFFSWRFTLVKRPRHRKKYTRWDSFFRHQRMP